MALVSKCIHVIVRYVLTCGVYYGRMSSVHASNVAVGCEYLDMSVNDVLSRRCGDYIYKKPLARCDAEPYNHAACLLELLMVRRGILCIPAVKSEDISEFIFELCNSWHTWT